MKLFSLLIILSITQATASPTLFGSGKKWWYKSNSCDSIYQKKSPGSDWSTTPNKPEEVCNGVDDNCNGITDEGLTMYTYFIDSNGDGFGEMETITVCNDAPPSGYTTQAPVIADFSFTSLNRNSDPNFWIFNTENLFYDGKTFSYPLTGFLNDRIRALQPNGFMYCGSPSHYVQYFTGDTINTAPRGFNPIPTTNKQTGYGISWFQSCFPSTVTLAQQCSAGILFQSSPTRNCDQFNTQISWMKSKGVQPMGLLVDQEYSDANWNGCENCGNGDAVAGDGTYWFNCVMESMPGLPYIIDAPYSLLVTQRPGSYGAKILNTIGYNSQRFYWAPSKGTPNLSSTMPINQLADSFDYAIDVMLPRIINAASRSAFCTSLYPEDIDPRGGKLASAGTWLNNYFVAKSFIAIQYSSFSRGAVFGRLDLLDVKITNGPNSLYYALQIMAPYFKTSGELYKPENNSDAILVDNNHHGFALLVNRSGIGYDLNYLSIDHYIVPVTGITQQVATGLSDTNPQIHTTTRIEPYSIAIISF